MDQNATLTIEVDGCFYTGPFANWNRYARALLDGKISRYRQSLLFGNQSMTAFFDHFRRMWDTSKRPLPTLEDFNIIYLRSAKWSQSTVISELIAA